MRKTAGVCASVRSIRAGLIRISAVAVAIMVIEIMRLIGDQESAAAAKTCAQTRRQLRKQKWNDPYLC